MILTALPLFGALDQWWPSMHYTLGGYAVTLTALLVFANYKARKLPISIPLLLALGILLTLIGVFSLPSLSLVSIAGLLSAEPYFFSFVLASEPRTSPSELRQQLVFAVSIAVLVTLLLLYRVNYSLFVSLLLANLGFALYRSFRKGR